MTWREDLGRVEFGGRKFVGASFRGVPFFVSESERSGGRRVVVHEFPLRADPFVEDLDRRRREFPITGHVIGDDYLVQRDALLAALEDEAGPGTLKHPYYGTKIAICDTVTVRETVDAGGMATFTIKFVEAPAQAPTPAIDVDGPGVVAAAADAAEIATQAEFTAAFNPTGMPAFSLDSAQAALTGGAAGLAAHLAPVVADVQELAALNGQLGVMTAQASSLVRQPALVIGQFLAAISGIVNTAASAPGAVVGALIAAYGADMGVAVAATTATRQRELANQLAITGALRRVMAIEAARLVPTVPFVAIEDAIAMRDQVAALLEEQAGGAGDIAFPGLVDLRSQLLRAVPGVTEFARIVTVTRRSAIPALLLAYQLYGEVGRAGERAADIIVRNRISNPAFVSGDLKVLSAD